MAVTADQKIDELERQLKATGDKKGSESSASSQESAAPTESQQPVQTGQVSQEDQGKLVEMPKTVVPLGQKNQDRLKQLWQSAHKPVPKSTPAPEFAAGDHRRKKEAYQQAVQASKEKPVPRTTPPPDIAKGTVAKAKEQIYGSTESQSESSQPQSTQEEGKKTAAADDYAFLKTPPSQLTTEEEKKKRQDLLLQKYVVDWKKKKEEEKESLIKELGEEAKTKEETRTSEPVAKEEESKLDKYMELGGHVNDFVDVAASSSTDIASLARETQNDQTGATVAGLVGSGMSVLTGSYATASSIYGARQAAQERQEKLKKGNRIGAKKAGFDIASNVLGAVGGASTVTGGLFGTGVGIASLAGADMEDHWANKTSEALGLTSTALGIGSSAIEAAKGGYHMYAYNKLANRRETDDSFAKMMKQYKQADPRYRKLKQAYRENKEALSREDKMEMLRQRHDRKRSKDFMETLAMAKEQAKIKSKEGWTDIASGMVSGLGGILSFTGGMFKALAGDSTWAKWVGTGLGVLGGIVGLSSKLAPVIGKWAQGRRQKSANVRRGKEYLEEKVHKLLRKPEAKEDHLTEDEAKLIVARRLEVEQPNNYEEIYKKLAERRADRILNKEEGYREVLAALGLDENADKATIMEALGAS